MQEGLLNPTADILKAMSEPETVHTGKIRIISIQSSIYLELNKIIYIFFTFPS